MKETTIKFIQKLTKADTKNLSQKALKVCEEAGELASEILPFESAHATTHRFSTKEKILEEVADVYLTSISVAFDLGFTYEDFEEMTERKMMKWAELQQRHTDAKYPVPYEIHITINEYEDAIQDSFRSVCKALDVKPIILALTVKDDELRDVMTSSKHYGDNQSAYTEMKRISQGLKRAGFTVVREKIETVPWHPAAPSEKHANPTMPKDCYFETHIGVFLPKESDDITQLRKDALAHWAKEHNAHLSRNAFKSMEDGYVQMITLRRYNGTYEEFQKETKALRDVLRDDNFQIENVITEFSVYDTRVGHDASWIQGK